MCANTADYIKFFYIIYAIYLLCPMRQIIVARAEKYVSHWNMLITDLGRCAVGARISLCISARRGHTAPQKPRDKVPHAYAIHSHMHMQYSATCRINENLLTLLDKLTVNGGRFKAEQCFRNKNVNKD